MMHLGIRSEGDRIILTQPDAMSDLGEACIYLHKWQIPILIEWLIEARDEEL